MRPPASIGRRGASSPWGELAVTISQLLGRRHVVPVAAAFLEEYPEVWLRLRLTDQVIDLQEEHIDLAVRIGDLPDSSLIARHIGSVRRVVCASPGYIARRERPERRRISRPMIASRSLDS
jgi:DNA-binding transcriptional LysR family regulator